MNLVYFFVLMIFLFLSSFGDTKILVKANVNDLAADLEIQEMDSMKLKHTHTVNHFMMKSFSTLDASWGMCKQDDAVKVVGKLGNRHIIKQYDYAGNFYPEDFFLDPFWDGKPTLILEKNSPSEDCNDLILLDDLVLLTKPISREVYDSLAMDFNPKYDRFGIFDYVDFGIRKGSFCNILEEEDDHYKIGVTIGESTFVGYINKTQNAHPTIKRNCDLVSLNDSRNLHKPPHYPDYLIGKYKINALSFSHSFELEIRKNGAYLIGSFVTTNDSGYSTTYENIDIAYNKVADEVSFWSTLQRTSIKIDKSGKVTGYAKQTKVSGERI